MKKIRTRLVLASIRYEGSNIGNDFEIMLTINAGEKVKNVVIKIEEKLSFQAVAVLNKELFALSLDPKELPLDCKIDFKVKELDPVFNDSGGASYSFPIMKILDRKQLFDLTVNIYGDPTGDKGRSAKLTFTFFVEEETLAGENEGGKFPPPLKSFLERIPTGESEYPILAFVSDLHIGTGGRPDDFDGTDEKCFLEMLDYLRRLQAATGRKLELILLGDIIDFWENKADENGSYISETASRAQKVQDAIIKAKRAVNAHEKVFSALKNFNDGDKRKVIYVRGNHDDDIDDEKVMEAVNAHIDKNKRTFDFRPFYLKGEYELIARHGHEYDKYNRSSSYGEKVLGRQIVETFSAEAERISALNTFPFRDVDAFRPASQYKKYFKCLTDKKLILSPRAVDRFLELSKQLNGPKKVVLDKEAAAQFLELSRRLNSLNLFSLVTQKIFLLNYNPVGVASFFAGLVEELGLADHPDNDDAKNLLGTEYRCALMGHTHDEKMVKFGEALYVNTGAWMDKLKFNGNAPDCTDTLPNRHLTIILREDKKSSPPARKSKKVFAFMFTFPGPQLTLSSGYTLKNPN